MELKEEFIRRFLHLLEIMMEGGETKEQCIEKLYWYCVLKGVKTIKELNAWNESLSGIGDFVLKRKIKVEGVNPPSPFLDRIGKPTTEWEAWFTRFQNYLCAAGLDIQDENQKIALLLHCVGSNALQFLYSENEEAKTFNEVVLHLSEKFVPKESLILKRNSLIYI